MIVFVTSVKEGVTDADEKVARILYKTDKPVILAVNKVDNPEVRSEIYDFYSLDSVIRFRFQGRMASERVICWI